MSKVEALTSLLAKVEAGAAPEYGIFRESRSPTIWSGLHGDSRSDAWNAYSGSLDAAKALHEAVIAPMDSGKWDFVITSYGDGEDEPLFEAIIARSDEVVDYQGHNDSPARAWLIAIIKALIAEASA